MAQENWQKIKIVQGTIEQPTTVWTEWMRWKSSMSKSAKDYFGDVVDTHFCMKDRCYEGKHKADIIDLRR